MSSINQCISGPPATRGLIKISHRLSPQSKLMPMTKSAPERTSQSASFNKPKGLHNATDLALEFIKLTFSRKDWALARRWDEAADEVGV